MTTPCIQHVRDFWARCLLDKGYGPTADQMFRHMEIHEARPGHLLCSMKIESIHLNGLGFLHGGIIMCLLDTCTWLALQAEGAPEVPSVSANMSCEYVRPAGQLGDTLWIQATIVQRGRKLAFSRVEFRLNDPESRVVAYGNHTQSITRVPQFTHMFGEDGGVVPVRKAAKL